MERRMKAYVDSGTGLNESYVPAKKGEGDRGDQKRRKKTVRKKR
jgi:hypothetical protein